MKKKKKKKEQIEEEGNKIKSNATKPKTKVITPAHCGPEQLKIKTEVLSHSLVRSLAPLTHFAHSLACGTVND